MTKRAKRLADYLHNDCGWEVHDENRTCKCGAKDFYVEHKFCAMCGAKLGKTAPHKDTYEQLEEAIKFALGEDYEK